MVQNSFGTPLEQLFSFGSNAGDSALGPSDDGNSDPIELTESFPFYGTDQSILFASSNNNGIISLNKQLFSFGSNAGDNGLGPSSDGYSNPIQLTEPFPFYGTGQSLLFASFYIDSTCNLLDKIEG